YLLGHQNGETQSSTRTSHPGRCTSSRTPSPEYSILASAIADESTVFLVSTSTRRTIPAIVISCFSLLTVTSRRPPTRRSPLGSTSVTMTEMVPVNVPSRFVAPLPPNLLDALPSMPSPRLASPPRRTPGIPIYPIALPDRLFWIVESRSAEVSADFDPL